MQTKFAIIDIGSNTIRLVIYDSDESGRFKEIENIKQVARLRDYLLPSGVLSEIGINLLVQTLRTHRDIMNHHFVTNVICVATATIRQSRNQASIITTVEAETGFSLRILSEYEEAFYGFLAVNNSTPYTEGITIDIGGGSTEITYFKNRELIAYHSFPFGALSLKRQFVESDIPTEEERTKLLAFVREQLGMLPWLTDRRLPIIAIGGSARNLVQVHQFLVQYPVAGLHLYEMNGQDIVDSLAFMQSQSFEDLQKLEALSKDRADIILPAVQVFHALYEESSASMFVLSRKGLRDGIFYEQLLKPLSIQYFPTIYEESSFELQQDFNIDLQYTLSSLSLANKVFTHLKEEGIASLTEGDGLLLRKAALAFYLGSYIDAEASSQHTFYLLANRTIDGLRHRDRVKLALVASYKNKQVFKQYISPFKNWFTKTEQKKLRLLGSILKVAYSMNATKRNIVDDISMYQDENSVIFDVFCNKNPMAEEYQVEKQKKHLEKCIKRNILFNFTV
ncbi:Ppx/GppA family phosphatase [Bacillus sp. HMF5848]|uniref:Ppx/GppA family phosphatase n=1 Tax=Bacillus sp. HMF5848 TaxID=2495421 RepID=UPI000F78D6D3|nr:Ppx/GppA family phosphatase [Bacillus sp. HMF5848]RSK26832.1 Ppx/GppA family phosphatase [Bacillus sp. HMF5848]